MFRLLHIRRGEAARVGWMGAVSLSFYAATTIGDDVAQSIFVSRVGIESLPNIFLFKALADVLAASVYLPLTRGRSPSALWRILLAVYMAVVAIGWALSRGGGVFESYFLYVSHEMVWTLLTIHWGVYLLSVFDASQSRRLFPLLFTVGRLGSAAGGAVVGSLSHSLGANHLMLAAGGMAALSVLFSLKTRRRALAQAGDDVGDSIPSLSGSVDGSPLRIHLAGALRSPLVRMIAVSTAIMVLCRYGLRTVSLSEFRNEFGGEDDLAAFLGTFAAVSNVAVALLGLVVVPRLLARIGVGAVNVLYAITTAAAFTWMWMAPGIAAAASMRFVDLPLKSAMKTPLSALFYGAESPARRASARAAIFGIAIPLATVAVASLFHAVDTDPEILISIGLAGAGVFTAVCAVQNRVWRRRLAHRLASELGGSPLPETAEAMQLQLRAAQLELDDDRAELVAAGLAAPRAETRALAEELLLEIAPRSRARRFLEDLGRQARTA